MSFSHCLAPPLAVLSGNEPSTQSLSCVDSQPSRPPLSEYLNPSQRNGSPRNDILVWKEAHIFRLPPELLAQIFLAVCERELHSCINHSDKGSEPYPGFTLSYVCSYWHKIALGTFRLWSKMEIVIMDKEDVSPRTIELINRFVDFHWKRMANAPLDFILHIPSPCSVEFSHPERMSSTSLRKHITPILQRFYAEAHRWRNVSISAFEHQFYSEGTRLPPKLAVAENLELFSLYCRRGCPLPEGLPFGLRSLTLSGEWVIDKDLSRTTFPCLDSLTLRGAIHDSYLLHLSPLWLASSRTAVTLSDFCNIRSLPAHKHIACLAGTLTLAPTFYGDTESTNGALSDLLEKLTLPNVTQLAFSYGPERKSPTSMYTRSFRFPTQIFLNLLERSNCQAISHLTIERYSMDTSGFLDILQKLPFLTYLSVDERCGPCDTRDSYPILSPVVFNSLCWPSPPVDLIKRQEIAFWANSYSELLPRLTEVRFVFHRSWSKFSDRSDVWEMLESRRPGAADGANELTCSKLCSPLKKIEILVPDGSLENRDYERLANLRMMGMRISLEEYRPRVVTIGCCVPLISYD
ncbi:hypothetical protein VKT23_009821 [Stygiomarasmius scandens]|uniref:F-box domain-containing protein n=1 Tax=Marasmiellus scandens TaxID=2682957 RepID=A0ABR1JDD0_9AGAR